MRRNESTMPNFFAFTELQYWVFLQVLVRVSTLVAVAPVFGAREIPATIKIGLALVLSVVLTPIAEAAMHDQHPPDTFYAMVAPLAANAMIGLTMGFVASLIITAVQMAGSLLDLEAGFTMAATFNPTVSDSIAPISSFQSIYALLLFLLCHGHYILIEALARSFHAAPGTGIDFGSQRALQFFGDVTGSVLINGLKIAAPAAAILIAVDVSFAFVSRAMPQMNIFFVGMPLKSLAGIALLAVVLPLFAVVVGQLVAGSPNDLGHLFESIRL